MIDFARSPSHVHPSIQHTLSDAQEVQRRCTPQGGVAGHLEVIIGYEPVDYLSGDYADQISVSDRQTILVLADVAGHGLSSAVSALRMHAVMHASLKAGLDLPKLADGLNEYLLEYTTEHLFVTMVCLLIDTDTGIIRYFNAGHPPPLLIDPCGKARELSSGQNLPLGVVAEPLKCESSSMEKGELLALFTDGWSDMRKADGAVVGLHCLCDRLCCIYRSHASASLREIRARFETQFRECDDRFTAEDDRTLVFARRV